MRYSSSMIAAIVICFFTFFGMSLLISTPSYHKSTDFEPIDFSMTEPMVSPDVTEPPKPLEPPKEPVVNQAPAALALDISHSIDRDSIALFEGKTKIKNIELAQIKLPKIGTNDFGTGINKNNGLIEIVAIQPNYPIDAQVKKIEGWVKVEFIVDEFGQPKSVTIIDSKPRRIFDNATKRAIYKSKFKPLMRDGKAVSQKAVKVIEFRIQD